MKKVQPKSIDLAWKDLLNDLIDSPTNLSPRGIATQELPIGQLLHIDMRRPVLINPIRKLSRKFMLGEAIWIMSGDDTTAGIVPFNPGIFKYSDDGQTFFGAYGPKIAGQRKYVVTKLLEDPASRQATINIWRENPPATRDVPCTLSMSFYLRGQNFNLLDVMVTMRSSDAWLGLPYDVFNFSMIAGGICSELYVRSAGRIDSFPGTLALALGSSHLYHQNLESAKKAASIDFKMEEGKIPQPYFIKLGWDCIVDELRTYLTNPELRWWKEIT